MVSITGRINLARRDIRAAFGALTSTWAWTSVISKVAGGTAVRLDYRGLIETMRISARVFNVAIHAVL
jgi:hypothetical protein